jgi:hypothetical protein
MKTTQQMSETIMNNHLGHLILRGNAVVLLAASAGGLSITAHHANGYRSSSAQSSPMFFNDEASRDD